MSCCREPDPAGGGVADELRERIGAGPCSFFVIVPDTTAAQYDPVAAGGVLPQPGMWWRITYYARPATGDVRAEPAEARVRRSLAVLLVQVRVPDVVLEGEPELGAEDNLAASSSMCRSCSTTSATLRSRSVWLAVFAAVAAASSQD